MLQEPRTVSAVSRYQTCRRPHSFEEDFREVTQSLKSKNDLARFNGSTVPKRSRLDGD